MTSACDINSLAAAPSGAGAPPRYVVYQVRCFHHLHGHGCSMGACRGSGSRRAPVPLNAEITIHQPPIGGYQGGGLSSQTTISHPCRHMVYIRDKMNRMLSEYTGQPLEKIQQDTERDNYLTAQQAKEYGLIDEVIAHR